MVFILKCTTEEKKIIFSIRNHYGVIECNNNAQGMCRSNLLPKIEI